MGWVPPVGPPTHTGEVPPLTGHTLSGACGWVQVEHIPRMTRSRTWPGAWHCQCQRLLSLGFCDNMLKQCFFKAWSTGFLHQHPVGYLLKMQIAGPLPRSPEGESLENRYRSLLIQPSPQEILMQISRMSTFWECGLENDLGWGAFSPTSNRRPAPPGSSPCSAHLSLSH